MNTKEHQLYHQALAMALKANVGYVDVEYKGEIYKDGVFDPVTKNCSPSIVGYPAFIVVENGGLRWTNSEDEMFYILNLITPKNEMII